MGRSSLRRRLSDWSLYRKIYVGYSVAIAITVAGVTAGFLTTRAAEQSALLIETEAEEDVQILTGLRGSLLEWLLHSEIALRQMRQSVSPVPENSVLPEIGVTLEHLIKDYEAFKLAWQTFKQSDEFTAASAPDDTPGVTQGEADVAAEIMKRYKPQIDSHLQQFSVLFEPTDPQTPSWASRLPSQTELIWLYENDFILDLENFLGQLTILLEEAELERQQAATLRLRASARSRAIIAFSIVLSSITGLLLMRLISRAICRPIEAMTQKTQQSIDGNLPALQLPIASQSEIGILAQTLNSYANRNAQLLRQHKEMNQQLKATLDELHLTQLQMVQHEKMSSLGQLVAGIAHEINNPTAFIYSNLSYVQGYTRDLLDLIQLYQSYYPDPAAAIQTKRQAIELEFIQDDLLKALSSIEIGSERICGIVRSLQNFSRVDASNATYINIHRNLDDTITILSHRTKACPEHPEIQIIRNYAALPEVECYPGLLNQVFANLLGNAIDALKEKMAAVADPTQLDFTPKITARTYRVDDDWVAIAISDNGLGMAQDIRQYIFNPFFTTKPIGKGTGMGLSISYQIVTERHRGTLSCSSALNQGTTFTITIPVQQSPASRQAAPV